ncbi:MAG: peptidylprolyl isomerase, partial [Chloroflexi bacterium]|nr:peptidylprolyl isomerase [Chloroflexota bacterium]
GYTIPLEDNGVKHGRGAISMLSSGNASNGGQFIIARQPMPALDGKQTIFGQVVTGMDVVGSLAQEDKILKITIEGP